MYYLLSTEFPVAIKDVECQQDHIRIDVYPDMKAAYSISDLSGRVLLKGPIEATKTKIDLGVLSQGRYELRLIGEDGFALVRFRV